MDWIKDYCDSDGHPQIRKAGFWAATAFRALCRVSGQYDLGGLIPPDHQDVEWLADRLKLPEDLVSALRNGIERLFAVGLLRNDVATDATEGVAWVIDGWSRRQTDRPKAMSSTERSRKHREAKRHDEPSSSEEQRNATAATSRPLQCNDGNGATLEESRGEERREEKKDHVGAAAPAPVASPSVDHAARAKAASAGWDEPLLALVFAAIASTRKRKMAESVWADFLESAAKFPPDVRARAAQTYLDRSLADEGKDERYLIGIMRGELERAGAAKPPKTGSLFPQTRPAPTRPGAFAPAPSRDEWEQYARGRGDTSPKENK